MGRRYLGRCLALVGGLVSAAPSAAQIYTPFIESAVPFTYNRGKNETVVDRWRPGYSALGIRAGGFTIFPSVDVGAGATDNVYQTKDNTTGDIFASVAPRIAARSNWSIHSLRMEAGANLIRYSDETARNEDNWYVSSDGKLDLSSNAAINFGLQTRQAYESRFSGAALDDVRSSTPYQSTLARVLGDFRFARTKLILAGDYTRFNFKTVETFAGDEFSQDNRDRDIARITGHAEYGITPDAGAFVQVGYTDTDYDEQLSATIANRSSKEIRALTGISFDLTALMRGSFAVGYIDRNYHAAVFNDIKGFSLDSKIEYFPTKLTTVTLAARRQIEDSTAFGSSGYFDTGVALRVDHELLRNLLLNAGAEYEHDKYRGISATADIYRASGGARYFLNQIYRLGANLSYAKRTSDGNLFGQELQEWRGLLSFSVQR